MAVFGAMLDTEVPSTCLSKGDDVSAALAIGDHDTKGMRAMKAACASSGLFRSPCGLVLESKRRALILSLSLSLAKCNAWRWICVVLSATERWHLMFVADLGLAMLVDVVMYAWVFGCSFHCVQVTSTFGSRPSV